MTTLIDFKIDTQNNQKTYYVYEPQYDEEKEQEKEFNKKDFTYLEVDKRTFEQLRSAIKYNKPNKFNKAIINYINAKAPEGFVYVRNDEESTVGMFDNTRRVFKYHITINNNPIYDDESYIGLYCEYDGFIDLRSVLNVLKSFKSKKILNNIEKDRHLKENIANNKIINNKDYVFTNDGYLDVRVTYTFNRNNTIINKQPYLFKTMELRHFSDLKENYDQYNRSNNFTIVDTKKSNDKEISYSIASLRQIINEKIPSFKIAKANNITKTTNEDLLEIGHISCKIVNKVYYLYEFNKNFPNFDITVDIPSFTYDAYFSVSLTKFPNDFSSFVNKNKIYDIISEEFNKYFGSLFKGTNFVYAFVQYSKIFASVYAYTFLKDKNKNEITTKIGHIFNNMRDTT